MDSWPPGACQFRRELIFCKRDFFLTKRLHPTKPVLTSVVGEFMKLKTAIITSVLLFGIAIMPGCNRKRSSSGSAPAPNEIELEVGVPFTANFTDIGEEDCYRITLEAGNYTKLQLQT